MTPTRDFVEDLPGALVDVQLQAAVAGHAVEHGARARRIDPEPQGDAGLGQPRPAARQPEDRVLEVVVLHLSVVKHEAPQNKGRRRFQKLNTGPMVGARTKPKVGTMNMNFTSSASPKSGVMPNVVPPPNPKKLSPVIW